MIWIETERLIVRDHKEDDLEPLHELLSNIRAMYYLRNLQSTTMDDSRENLYEAIKESKMDKRTKYYFAITLKETNKYVGEIGFTVKKSCSEGKVVDLGYFIMPEHWRQGYVTEAAKSIIDFAFQQLDIIKIETGCLKVNEGSESVMIKLGMTKEAELMKHQLWDNSLHDRVEYRIMKEEWIE